MTTKAAGEPVVIEAIAEQATGELQTISVWPPGKRQGAPLAELALVSRDVGVDESQWGVRRDNTDGFKKVETYFDSKPHSNKHRSCSLAMHSMLTNDREFPPE
jgi:hypothetical protein